MNSKDLIICQKNGKVYSCGYAINSFFLENNIKPIHTYDDNCIIPAGMSLFASYPKENKNCSYSNQGTIHDSLFNRLVNLLDTKEKSKYRNNQTMKRKIKSKNKTLRFFKFS